jgi:hypothetical protein
MGGCGRWVSVRGHLTYADTDRGALFLSGKISMLRCAEVYGYLDVGHLLWFYFV